MAAFGEPELLDNAFTSRLAEIRVVLEELLGHQMIVQATLVDRFVAAAREAGWSAGAINGGLARSVSAPARGEVRVLSRAGKTLYAAGPANRTAPAPAERLASLVEGTQQAAAYPAARRVADGAFHKQAAVASALSPLVVLVGLPLDDSSPVSPDFPGGSPAASSPQRG